MIVTGPTVIAPLLRQAKLSHRPAALLQWEAIVNDPIGALAAVLAYEVIVVSVAASTVGEASGSTDHRFDRLKRCGRCGWLWHCPSVQTRMGS